jgi:hypothetical protein
LPAGYADPGSDMRHARTLFRSLVDTFAREAELEPILERFSQDFVASRRPDFSGALQDAGIAPAITARTRVEPRPHLIYVLRAREEHVELQYGASTITLPAAVAEPLKFALRGQPFVVRDLPGRLDEASKIVLVRRLIKEGLLVTCNNKNRAGSHPRR